MDAAEESPQRGATPLHRHQQTALDMDEAFATAHSPTIRYQSSKRKRALVLLGSAMLQLPIWGFAMSYGVFQEYYNSNWSFKGNKETTGIIGTTSNGVMYLSMPFLFALFTRKWAHKRMTAALAGVVLTCVSFLLSSFSTHLWHLVLTQGVLSAFGCALIYSPTTLSLGEWFNHSNRALAYGIVLSCKNIVGSACPFLIRSCLDQHGFRNTIRIWGAVAGITSAMSVFLVPAHPPSLELSTRQSTRLVPWSFLKHRTIYIYAVAIILQSCGYGIPQTYLNTYAHDVAALSQASATLLLTLFNLPGIASSSFFGYLSDNRWLSISASTVTSISAICSALSAFLLWGLTSTGSMALLAIFSSTFGFFAGGYSATWGGVINEMESEAARQNEAFDPGLLYGLLNGARGIGYVLGGFAGVELLQAGAHSTLSSYAYATSYGPLIIFTGLTSLFGGWSVLWKWHTWKCW